MAKRHTAGLRARSAAKTPATEQVLRDLGLTTSTPATEEVPPAEGEVKTATEDRESDVAILASLEGKTDEEVARTLGLPPEESASEEPGTSAERRGVILAEHVVISAEVAGIPALAPIKRTSRIAPLAAKVVAALRESKRSVPDMAKMFDVSERDIRLAIDKARAQGEKIERLAPKVFGYPERAPVRRRLTANPSARPARSAVSPAPAEPAH